MLSTKPYGALNAQGILQQVTLENCHSLFSNGQCLSYAVALAAKYESSKIIIADGTTRQYNHVFAIIPNQFDKYLPNTVTADCYGIYSPSDYQRIITQVDAEEIIIDLQTYTNLDNLAQKYNYPEQNWQLAQDHLDHYDLMPGMAIVNTILGNTPQTTTNLNTKGTK